MSVIQITVVEWDWSGADGSSPNSLHEGFNMGCSERFQVWESPHWFWLALRRSVFCTHLSEFFLFCASVCVNLIILSAGPSWATLLILTSWTQGLWTAFLIQMDWCVSGDWTFHTKHTVKNDCKSWRLQTERDWWSSDSNDVIKSFFSTPLKDFSLLHPWFCAGGCFWTRLRYRNRRSL